MEKPNSHRTRRAAFLVIAIRTVGALILLLAGTLLADGLYSRFPTEQAVYISSLFVAVIVLSVLGLKMLLFRRKR